MWTTISSIYVNRLELKTIKSLTVLVMCLKSDMILFRKLTKIMFVLISFLHLISVIAFMFHILKNPKRFSTTDVGKLIFKISKAKHDE